MVLVCLDKEVVSSEEETVNQLDLDHRAGRLSVRGDSRTGGHTADLEEIEEREVEELSSLRETEKSAVKSGSSGYPVSVCREVFSIVDDLGGLGVIENNREIEYKDVEIKHEIPDFIELPKNRCESVKSFDVRCVDCGFESVYRYGDCDDPRCFVDHVSWSKKQAFDTALRLLKGCKSTDDKVWHLTLSPPENSDDRTTVRNEEYLEEILKEGYDLLKDHGLSGGVAVLHYGPEKNDQGVGKYLPGGEYRPHIHIFAHGERPKGPWENRRGPWIIKTLNSGLPVEKDFQFLKRGLVYQLSHALRRQGHHSLRWFGDWSYSSAGWGDRKELRREALRKDWIQESEEIDGFEVVAECPKCGGSMVKKSVRDRTGSVESTEFIQYGTKGPPHNRPL